MITALLQPSEAELRSIHKATSTVRRRSVRHDSALLG